jgi:predicted CXXCH cytochrome family protein
MRLEISRTIGLALGAAMVFVPVFSLVFASDVDLFRLPPPNPHWAREGCGSCHLGPKPRWGERPRLKFGGDTVALCNSCHVGRGIWGEMHPVGVEIPEPMEEVFGMLGGLPLARGRLTCRTCHNAIIQCRLLDRDRRENPAFLHLELLLSGPDPCFSCHRREDYRAMNPHDQIDESGSVVKRTCLFCHRRRPLGPLALKDDVTALCLRCHKEGPHPETVDHLVVAPRWMVRRIDAYGEHLRTGKPLNFLLQSRLHEALDPTRLILPLDKDGLLTCATCHRPHEAGLLEKLSYPSGKGPSPASLFRHRKRISGQELCQVCHE